MIIVYILSSFFIFYYKIYLSLFFIIKNYNKKKSIYSISLYTCFFFIIKQSFKYWILAFPIPKNTNFKLPPPWTDFSNSMSEASSWYRRSGLSPDKKNNYFHVLTSTKNFTSKIYIFIFIFEQLINKYFSTREKNYI